MRITEIKHHLDGRVERFDCRLVLRLAHVVVLRFDHPSALRPDARSIPKGSRTYGFLWRRRPYLLYRIEGPDGSLIAHRFDVVAAVHLGEREVSYTDLLLDVWVDAAGKARVEDEDEVADYIRRGQLSATHRMRIHRTRHLLLRRHAAIAREASRILALADR